MKTGHYAEVALAATTDTILVPHNDARIFLAVSPPLSGTLHLAYGKAASATNGWSLTTTSPPLILRVDEVGGLVRQDLHAFASGALTASIIEGFARG